MTRTLRYKIGMMREALRASVTPFPFPLGHVCSPMVAVKALCARE